MKKLLAPLAAAAACLALASCQSQPAPVQPARLADDVKPAATRAPTDLEKLAERLVRQGAAVKEGEVVLIASGAENMELLENIAVQVRKAGGDNKTPYGYFVSLPGATVRLDGKPVVGAGQLKL